jgi:hypothetical protein
VEAHTQIRVAHAPVTFDRRVVYVELRTVELDEELDGAIEAVAEPESRTSGVGTVSISLELQRRAREVDTDIEAPRRRGLCVHRVREGRGRENKGEGQCENAAHGCLIVGCRLRPVAWAWSARRCLHHRPESTKS